MDVGLDYPAWLLKIDNETSTLTLTFDDESSVLFSLKDHVTRINIPEQPLE